MSTVDENTIADLRESKRRKTQDERDEHNNDDPSHE